MCVFQGGGCHDQMNVVESLLIHTEEPVLPLSGGADELQALASVHRPCSARGTSVRHTARAGEHCHFCLQQQPLFESHEREALSHLLF